VPNPNTGVTMRENANAVLGLFDNVDRLMAAVPQVKSQKLGRLEAYTPYPIHGLAEALELRRSPVGGMVLVMGVLGALTALGFEYWVSAVDYPIVTGGKAPGSWEAFVPIMFEVMVLFATFTAGLAMLLLLARLPFYGHPVLASKAIAGITRDRFALSLERDAAHAGALDVEAAKTALVRAGASAVEVLPTPAAEPYFDGSFVLRAIGAIAGACLVSGTLMYWAIKMFPVLPPMCHMLDQPRLSAQQPSTFFGDRHGMRMPVVGTIARGAMPLGVTSPDEATVLVNPVERTPETLALGKTSFSNRCATCHGPLATGVGSLTAEYGAKPANLQAEQFRGYKDGQIYWVIVNGKNAMPSHAADLDEDQRWEVVHYVRALQRAQNANDDDLR
jgi:mono/diheme cytochrome c family protein